MNGAAYSGAALGRSARHFLTGKVLSAAITLAILLGLVRVLPVEQYAAYVTLVAAMELAFALSFVGLPWLAARYLPEFRIHGTNEQLAGLCWRLVIFHALMVLVFAALLALLLDAYLDLLGLAEYRSAALIYLLVFIAEAMGRFMREGVLGALLQQGIAQASQVLRSLLFLILLLALHYTGNLDLEQVAKAELAASIGATLFALAGLWRYLGKPNTQANTHGWAPPLVWRMWPTAAKMYASELLTLVHSPQLVLNVIQYWLGAGAAATFGFLCNLYGLISRYLPATLLFSLVRPKLVASYVQAGDIDALSRKANLAGKLSLLVLMPAVAFAAAGGSPLVNLLSGGKFPDTGLLLFGLMLALVPFSQRQLLETVAVATGHAGLCIKAAWASLAIPLLLVLMLEAGFGLWAGVIGIGLGQLIFVMVVLYGTRVRAGFRSDHVGFARLAAAGLLGYLTGILMPAASSILVSLAITAVGVSIGYLIAIWLLQPVARNERARLLSSFLNRP